MTKEKIAVKEASARYPALVAEVQGVPPRYKQTEVGVIPKEWNVAKLRECLVRSPDYGINAPAVPYSDSLPTYIRITGISEDGRFGPESLVSVENENSGNYFLEEGALVFARTGASVGKSYLYDKKDGQLVYEKRSAWNQRK